MSSYVALKIFRLQKVNDELQKCVNEIKEKIHKEEESREEML